MEPSSFRAPAERGDCESASSITVLRYRLLARSWVTTKLSARERGYARARIRRCEPTGHEDIISKMARRSAGEHGGKCLLESAADAEHRKALGLGVHPFVRVRFRHRSVAAQLSTLSWRLFLARLFR